MAFNQNSLNTLCYADRFTLWKYTTPDTGAYVLSPGYFDMAYKLVRDCDMILTVTDIGSSLQAGVLVVTRTKTPPSVTVANIGVIK